MAKETFERLNSFDKFKYPSNTLDDYYDLLHQLMEALSLKEGIKFQGDNAHKELIDFVSKIISLPEKDRLLLQEIRFYRNKISYEGFFIKRIYIERNQNNLERLISLFENKIIL